MREKGEPNVLRNDDQAQACSSSRSRAIFSRHTSGAVWWTLSPVASTATRMDKFTEMMLAETGLIAMVGKAERGPVAIEAIRKHKAAYLMAVGGAAYLVARAIKGAKVVGFADLGMEAIYEFEVKDMPVTVAVDATGESVHHTAPLVWREKIAKERLLEQA